MTKKNKEEENRILGRFKELYEGFPEGDLSHPDRPDFIISGATKIGIEIIRVYHSDEQKRNSAEKSDFTDIVISKLVPLLPFHFSLTVDSKAISKFKRNDIAEQTALICAQEFSKIEDKQHAHIEHIDWNWDSATKWEKKDMIKNGWRNLPIGVSSISIYRYDAHGSSFNSNTDAAFIPNFTIERLNEILKEKEVKLKGYKVCDQQWLLIAQVDGLSGYFSKIDFSLPIQSSFDKVFLFRSIQNDVVILK